MLSKHNITIASIIANSLLRDGMIWGDCLEWYIKSSTNGLIEFQSDLHYLLFENKVLDYIDDRIKKAIKVTNIESGHSKVYLTISSISKDINKSKTCIWGYTEIRVKTGSIFHEHIDITGFHTLFLF